MIELQVDGLSYNDEHGVITKFIYSYSGNGWVSIVDYQFSFMSFN